MLRRRLPLLLAPLLLTGLLLAQQELTPPDATAAPEDVQAPPPVPTTSATLEIGGETRAIAVLLAPEAARFPLPVLATALGAELGPGPGGVGWRLVAGEVETILAPGSRLTTVGRQIVELQHPVIGGDGGPWVPLELLRRTLGDAGRWELQWNEAERRLLAVAHQQRLLAVDWSLVHLQGISTLVLQFPEAPRLRVLPAQERPEGGKRVEVQVLADQLAPPVRPAPTGDPLVRGLTIVGDRIQLDVAPGAVVEHYQQQEPFRIVFDVYQRVAAGPDTPIAAEPQRPTIVVDPGHGGVETGAIGPSGTQEKELTLLLAQGLARELERQLPVRVELTRDEDADLPLDTRAAIANQHKANLFVSLHLNSSVGANAHGAETYFLSLDASDARAAAAASAENREPAEGAAEPQPVDPVVMADLQMILWDLAQTRHLAESQRLANLVQEELNGALGLRDRGVKQAPFRVLMGAAMPAVLVELGFISNPEEEKKLLVPAYRDQLVDALVRAIARFHGRPAQVPAGEPPQAAATTR
jgi:N-acetylmuramoyl-L-alanine amidase